MTNIKYQKLDKSEIRISKSETNSNFQMFKTKLNQKSNIKNQNEKSKRIKRIKERVFIFNSF